MITVKSLYYYPIKSCAGIKTNNLSLGSMGPVGDREYMIVDNNGKFISQRTHPKLALIKTELVDSELYIVIQNDKMKISNLFVFATC